MNRTTLLFFFFFFFIRTSNFAVEAETKVNVHISLSGFEPETFLLHDIEFQNFTVVFFFLDEFTGENDKKIIA